MSARPRPVTATVNPPLTSTPLHGPRTFLSSYGSTESLISILDHDSYESLPFTDFEQTPIRVMEEKPTQIPKTSVQNKILRKTAVPSHTDDGRLTPWENWLVKKAKEMRIQEMEELATVTKVKEEEKSILKEKAMKDQKCETAIKNWNDQKAIERRTRKLMDGQCLNAEKELNEEKKLRIEKNSIASFDKWQQQKLAEEKECKQKEKEKHEEEERKKEERKQKCDAKYKAWLKDAKKRPKSAPHSYGYAQGKLVGFYDRAAYPSPTFFNPIPWQPIHVPNQLTVKKSKVNKSKVRKRFNPNKYL